MKLFSWSEISLRELGFFHALNPKAEIMVDGDKQIVVVVENAK